MLTGAMLSGLSGAVLSGFGLAGDGVPISGPVAALARTFPGGIGVIDPRRAATR